MDYLKRLNKEIRQPIFVIGMPRSGTTVISETMSVHEDLGWFSNYFSKLPFFPEISFLTRIFNIPKIGWYLRGKKRQDSRFSSYIKKFLPYCSEAYTVWSRCCGDRFLWDYMLDQFATEKENLKINSVIRKVLLFQGKDRFFAKLTGPPRINYLNSLFPGAFFIHVIRDPRATVSSLMRVPFWKEHGGFNNPWWRNGLPQDAIKEWIDSGRSPIALAGLQWKNIVDVTWQESKIIDDSRYIELHYENFVNSPYKILKEVLNKVGLSESQNIRRHIYSIEMIKDMNYKFRQNLKNIDIHRIERITSQTAKKAGYIF